MSSRQETFVIEKSLPSERLDTFLRRHFPDVSRGAIQRLIEQGHIRVDGRTTKPTHTPRAGETVEVEWPEARPAEAQPEQIPLDILFEDEALLVLNKTAGLVVHPAAGHEEHTLVNALLHHCAGQLSGIGGVARPGIVHRLDKETSGCMVVASITPSSAACGHARRETSARPSPDTRRTENAWSCARIKTPARRTPVIGCSNG
jgi:23S rRNA pseudouridine1911/1915/1917 synthase